MSHVNFSTTIPSSQSSPVSVTRGIVKDPMVFTSSLRLPICSTECHETPLYSITSLSLLVDNSM